MTIPDEIKVGAHTIKIEQAKSKEIDGAGEFRPYYDIVRLRIDSECSESSTAECFLHEIIEVIKSKYGLEIDHTHLTVLSEVLFQVIRDNRLAFMV